MKKEKTVQDVLDTFNDEQLILFYSVIGNIVQSTKKKNDVIESEKKLKHNAEPTLQDLFSSEVLEAIDIIHHGTTSAQ